MQVGLLPFIVHPVTEYSIVYKTMKNFVSPDVQLRQKSPPAFCDEGIFRIVLDIFLDNLDEFKDLLPILRGFHLTKTVLHAIGRYVKQSGLDDILKHTWFCGSKTLESVIAGTHYV